MFNSFLKSAFSLLLLNWVDIPTFHVEFPNTSNGTCSDQTGNSIISCGTYIDYSTETTETVTQQIYSCSLQRNNNVSREELLANFGGFRTNADDSDGN